MNKNEIRESIHQLVFSINAVDPEEEKDLRFTCEWIKSGVEIFRVQKPATPDIHLVSYFVVIDTEANQILLTDHKKAGLWLPPGGHVEIDEYPKDTAIREAMEELGMQAVFLLDEPIFLTVTKTVGNVSEHTDISLWYLLKGDSNNHTYFDREEFNEVRWFSLDELPYDKSDPHMKRFVKKLNTILEIVKN